MSGASRQRLREEKIVYVNDLWDRITVAPEEVPLPDWHRQILDERLARDDAHPEEGLPWEEVKQEILRDLKASSAER